ncbi:MAG: 50S ribosomal protein L23 [Peptococcaceae bacterium]|jgi:large subunit ribosomal protein L23|nr:50S ribosomal protein L23 [Peptococcaceae bacterium]
MRDLHDVLIRPVITEKTSDMMAENKYTFRVDKRANKIEIKQAVESIFHVDVTHVRTMNVPGKLKRQGRTSGMTAQWKKAIITLKDGQKLPIFDE